MDKCQPRTTGSIDLIEFSIFTCFDETTLVQTDCFDLNCSICDDNTKVYSNLNSTDVTDIEFNCQDSNNYVVADIECPQTNQNNLSLYIATNVPMENIFDVDIGPAMSVLYFSFFDWFLSFIFFSPYLVKIYNFDCCRIAFSYFDVVHCNTKSQSTHNIVKKTVPNTDNNCKMGLM